jgi:hypothetical protein
VIVSSPAFLAERQEQSAEAERKLAATVAAKATSASKREADQLAKAINSTERAAKKQQKVWISIDCMGWTSRGRFHTTVSPSFRARDSGGGGGGEGGGRTRREATVSQQEAQNSSESVALRQFVLQGKGRRRWSRLVDGVLEMRRRPLVLPELPVPKGIALARERVHWRAGERGSLR